MSDDAARSLLPAPGAAGNEHWLTRFLVLRLLGLLYLMAFLTWVFQGPALVGHQGLIPTGPIFDQVRMNAGSRLSAFWQAPSLFWLLGHSDAVLFGSGWVGVALATAVMLGYANVPLLVVLWALQLSIADAGQVFYGFGWELQLGETGFLCIFLVPLLDGRPFPRLRPSPIVIWLLRWLIVRVMWGAGLIKLRGDPCWRDLTCLDTYFETQPIPNPLTPFFHAWPNWMHRGGVLYNHVVELVAPVLVFCPRRARLIGGGAMAALQLSLILSGNLSFLNWLTLVPILACFDDGVWRRLLPTRLTAFADRAAAKAEIVAPLPRRVATIALGIVVGVLSLPVLVNLASGKQAMNRSFTRLPLVNTYGAFGSVNRQRNELIFEGTRDEVVTADSRWTAYEWKCKPGDPARAPCWMSPYHRRLDWLAWFAAMSEPARYPFTVHLVWKLLQGDRGALGLLAGDPFAGQPPRHVRVELYRYQMNGPLTKGWWTRTRIGEWLPPLSLDDPNLRAFLEAEGWL